MSVRFVIWVAAILAAGFLLLGLGFCSYDKLREAIEEEAAPSPSAHQRTSLPE